MPGLNAHAADDAYWESSSTSPGDFFNSALAEKLPSMVFALEAHSLRFAFLNAAGENLLGMPREHVIGMSVREVFLGAMGERLEERCRASLKTKQVSTDEGLIQTRHNGARFLRTRLVGVTDHAGRLNCLLQSKGETVAVRENWGSFGVLGRC